MAKTAIYHQEGGNEKVFAILKENKDGTVDLGPEGGEAIITSCPITDAPVPGSCTVAPEPAKKEKE